MKKGLTDITLILDRSGSMNSVRDDTIGGVNEFLKEQKKAPGDAVISLMQFDDVYEIVYAGAALKGAPKLTRDTFVPRGWTALLDAIGNTINAIGARLSGLPEESRPEKVIVAIITDGGENASKTFTNPQIREMIKHQQDNYSWEFVFIGANQDAIATGSAMGIGASNSMTYAANSVGTQSAFASLSVNTVSFRAGNKAGMSFEDSDRVAQAKAGVVNTTGSATTH
jgi:hypothetical protein